MTSRGGRRLVEVEVEMAFLMVLHGAAFGSALE